MNNICALLERMDRTVCGIREDSATAPQAVGWEEKGECLEAFWS